MYRLNLLYADYHQYSTYICTYFDRLPNSWYLSPDLSKGRMLVSGTHAQWCFAFNFNLESCISVPFRTRWDILCWDYGLLGHLFSTRHCWTLGAVSCNWACNFETRSILDILWDFWNVINLQHDVNISLSKISKQGIDDTLISSSSLIFPLKTP